MFKLLTILLVLAGLFIRPEVAGMSNINFVAIPALKSEANNHATLDSQPAKYPVQLKEIIKAVHKYLNIHNPDLVYLLLYTSAIESDLGKLNKQRGGPALGIFQILPSTEKWLLHEYLPKAKPVLHKKISKLKRNDLIPGVSPLRSDLVYQIALATAYYLQRLQGKPVPSKIDKQEIWQTYTKYWNTNKLNNAQRKAAEKKVTLYLGSLD